MTVHRLMWKPAQPTVTLNCGVHGVQYLFDDETQEVIQQEVVDYDQQLRQVVAQVTLSPSDVPSEVRESIGSVDLWRDSVRAD